MDKHSVGEGNTMKKKLQYLLAVLTAVAVCASIYVLSKYANSRTGDILSRLDGVVTTLSQPHNPATTPPTDPPAVPPPTAPHTPSAVQTPTAQPSAAPVLNTNPTTAEILTAVCNAVNSIKTAQNFIAVKDQDVKIQLTECSISFAVRPVNALIERFTGEQQLYYEFINGSCIGPRSGEPVTPMLVIPPSERTFALDPNGVTHASAVYTGGNMVYTVKIREEACTLENQVPYYHAMAMDYINVAGLDLGPAKVTQADIIYRESTITVTVDGNGKILVYEEFIPVDAVGGGSIGISASGVLTGSLWERWTFTW